MRWMRVVCWHPVLVNTHLTLLIVLCPVDASPQPPGGALPSDGEFYQLSPHRCLSVHRLRCFWSRAALGGVWALRPSGGHTHRDVQQRCSPVSVWERSVFQRCVNSTSPRFLLTAVSQSSFHFHCFSLTGLLLLSPAWFCFSLSSSPRGFYINVHLSALISNWVLWLTGLIVSPGTFGTWKETGHYLYVLFNSISGS